MGYETAVALAQRLIQKKGRLDGVLRRPSADAQQTPGKPWAPTDPQPTVDPVVAQELAVVVLDAALFKREQLTPLATAVAYLAAASIGEQPRVGDILETRTERYSLDDVQVLSPGATTILYTLMLKA